MTTAYTDEQINTIASKTGVKAVDVLREVMTFHHEKAKDIILSIITLLKKEEKPRGDLLANMYKEYSRNTDLAVDCAAKLAPFESPKLQSMEVKNEMVHKFVMRVPAQSMSTDDWMQATGAKRAVIEQKIAPNVEDIEYEDEIPQIDNDSVQSFETRNDF